MFEKINNISSSAVKKATGKDWEEWIKFLDKLDAEKLESSKIRSEMRIHRKDTLEKLYKKLV